MNTTIGTVIIDIKADTAKLVDGMTRAENSVKKSIGSMKRAIVSMVAAYAGIESVRAFKGMIEDSLDAADATGKLAQKLGLATSTLSEYQYTASFAGVSNGELNAGLSALIRRLNNFQRDGGGAAKKAFGELGISAQYAREHFTSTDIAFQEIVKRLEEMPDGFKKTAIAQDIFSKSASGLMQLTATDLKKYSQEAKDIGMSISDSTAQMAAAYHDQMDSMSARLKGMKQSVAFGIIAPMNAASQTAFEMMDTAFGSSATNQMLAYEDIAVTVIGNVAYSFGMITDTITGIKLVINSIKIAFYGLAGIISAALEGPRQLINSLIDGYNLIAGKLGKETFDFKLQSSMPDIANNISDITKEMGVLIDSLSNGRNSADDFTRRFKNNLVKIKNAAKYTTTSVNTPVTTSSKNPTFDRLDTSSLDQYAYNLWKEKEDKKAKILQDNQAKKTTLQQEYNDLLTANQVSALDNQIALAESAMNWSNNLSGIAGQISDIGKASQAVYVADLKAKKAEADVAKRYDSKIKKYEKANIDTTKLKIQKDQELGKIKKEQNSAELRGYSDLAGAMGSAYEQGSTQALAFAAVQSTLGIAASWTAIAEAWALPYPANLAAVPIVTAGVLPIIQQLSGGSGGGSSSAVAPVIYGDKRGADYYSNSKDIAEQTNQPILDKFDRQIALLQEIRNNGGTTTSLSLEKALVTYTSQTTLDIIDAASKGTATLDSFSGAKDKADWYLAGQKTLEENFIKDLGDIGKYVTGWYGVTGAGVDSGQETFASGVSILDEAFSSSSEFINFIEYLKDNDLLEELGYTQVEYENIINSFKNTTSDFAQSLLSDLGQLTEFSTSLKDISDSLTGTDTFKTTALEQAYSDVNSLIGTNTLDDYINTQIGEIDTLFNSLTENDIALLLSNNLDDYTAQQELILRIQQDSLITLDSGVINALNYKDSIDLVSEAMINSNDNIKSWTDSFKTQDELTLDLANGLGLSIVKTQDELTALFENLKGGLGGLTDSELTFLNANKAYIDNLQSIQDKLLDGWMTSLSSAGDKIAQSADSLRAISTPLTQEDYFKSFAQTKDYLTSGNYDAFQTSLTETLSMTNTLSNSDNFSNQRDMQFAQLTAANQLDSLGEVVNYEYETMKSIAENTSKTYQAQVEQNALIDAQAKEIQLMRKEIQDQSDYLASIEEKIA